MNSSWPEELSVVIVNWNTAALLRACLRSLFAHPPKLPFEVIVVDNASRDGSAAIVREEFPEAKLVEPGSNTGYAKGNNLGFAIASGRFVLTLNPDTEVGPGTLDAALLSLRNDSSLGCVGVRQIDVKGKTQSSVRGFPSLFGILGDLLKIRVGVFDSYRLSSFDYTKEQRAPQPMGTFLMFNRGALEQVTDPRAPFDEGFPIFFNEVDLLYRLNEAGFGCVYNPKAEILHYGGESTKQVRPMMIWESHRSLIRFFSKHAHTPWQRIRVMLLAPIVYLGAWVRARGFNAGFRA